MNKFKVGTIYKPVKDLDKRPFLVTCIRQRTVSVLYDDGDTDVFLFTEYQDGDYIKLATVDKTNLRKFFEWIFQDV